MRKRLENLVPALAQGRPDVVSSGCEQERSLLLHVRVEAPSPNQNSRVRAPGAQTLAEIARMRKTFWRERGDADQHGLHLPGPCDQFRRQQLSRHQLSLAPRV